MLYFAYGSKMNTSRMDKVCDGENYKILGKCKLPGFKFEYNGHSNTWKGLAGDIVESKNDFVWGVLYDIPDKYKEELDKSEGYREDRPRIKNTYEPIDITEHLTECGRDDIENVFTYKHINIQKRNRLSCKYRDIVVCGANQHEIDKGYIREFLDVPCVEIQFAE